MIVNNHPLLLQILTTIIPILLLSQPSTCTLPTTTTTPTLNPTTPPPPPLTKQSLNLTITNQNNTIIYPFPQPLKQQLLHCGINPAVKIYNDQIIYLKGMKPFIGTLETQEKSVQIIGYCQSMQQDDGVSTCAMIITTHCQYYFSTVNLQIILKLYPLTQQTQKFTNPLIIKLPSYTFCLDENELLNIQKLLHYGYIILFVLVLSMLPTFPIGKFWLRVGIVFVVFVSQGVMLLRGNVVVFGCLLAVRSNKEVREEDLEIQHRKEFRLFRASLTTVFLTYFSTFVVNWLTGPSETQLIQNLSTAYTINIYLQNLCQMLIVTQLLTSIFWLNRFRYVFWWSILTLTITLLIQKYHPLIPSYTFGLLLPSIFSTKCQYYSLISIIMIAPVYQYFDRFNKGKSLGVFVVVVVVLVELYDRVSGILAGIGLIGMWVVVELWQQGSFFVFNRRWLGFREVEILTG